MKQITIYEKAVVDFPYHAESDCELSTVGNKILLVGCDPKANSTRMLLGDLNQKKLYKKSF